MSCLRLAACVLAVSVVASSARADGGLAVLENTTPTERATAQTTMMTSKLDLTEAEKPKIAAINQKYAERMDPVIKGSEGPLMKVRTVKEIEGEKEAELKAVLTPEQFAKFLASKDEMREHLMDRITEQRAQGKK